MRISADIMEVDIIGPTVLLNAMLCCEGGILRPTCRRVPRPRQNIPRGQQRQQLGVTVWGEEQRKEALAA